MKILITDNLWYCFPRISILQFPNTVKIVLYFLIYNQIKQLTPKKSCFILHQFTHLLPGCSIHGVPYVYDFDLPTDCPWRKLADILWTDCASCRFDPEDSVFFCLRNSTQVYE